MTQERTGEIRRNTLSEQILDSVLDMIKNDGYAIGDKLFTEKEIAQRLGVGRNSVREAMKTLNMAGITESTAGKGTFLLVNPDNINRDASGMLNCVSKFSLTELLEARQIIETEAAVLATERAVKDSKEWKSFVLSHELLVNALENKLPDASLRDFEFHVCLMKLSGNYFLYKMHQSIVSDIQKSKKIITIDYENSDREVAVHKKVFDAINGGNAGNTREVMRAHFENVMEYCRKIKVIE